MFFRISKIILSLFLLDALFCCPIGFSMDFSEPWKDSKSDHFIAYYYPQHRSFAQRVLRESELYYDKIASQIGYSRYENFWTWDNRVQIALYPDQKMFVESTGQPLWSRGGALYHSDLFQKKTIVAFVQEDNFMEDILPHEIGHLMLGDFMGGDVKLPVWFEEGVAQLQEKTKKKLARNIAPKIVKAGHHIEISLLKDINIGRIDDPLIASIFYVQSFSLVDFMISQYGADRFLQLCRHLRDGLPMETALQKAYIGIFDSMLSLEKKWVRYMKNF